KSSILQLIALGLINISKVPFTQSWKEVVQKNNTTGSFQLDITIDEKPAAIKCQIDETDTITCTEGTELRKEKQDSFMMLAYGVNRNIKLQEIPPYEDIDPIATLFGENGYLKHIKITTNYERIKSDFPHVRDLINSVLEKSNGGENVVLTKLDANGFYFKTPSSPDVPVPTEALSEGFKSTFAWLLDAIIRIVENGGNPANVEEVTGIILLDEIDLHLHPSWQRTILHSIAGLFPNIQFIVTTHSPFVVQSAGPAGIIALETDTKNNAMTARPPEVTSELSYNAIVREIFKIDFPFSREVEDQMKRFREFELLIRGNKKYDKKEFIQLVLDIADRGVELEGVMRREIRSLERRTGKNFKLWKK
ncbi:MAG: AAA family ATPase, partial [bacterium]|nr:AAA family ATPase [bacterium]